MVVVTKTEHFVKSLGGFTSKSVFKYQHDEEAQNHELEELCELTVK